MSKGFLDLAKRKHKSVNKVRKHCDGKKKLLNMNRIFIQKKKKKKT